MKPDYGIDAPGIRRGMLVAGVTGLTLVMLGAIANMFTSGWVAGTATFVSVLAGLVALYGLGMAAYMTYGSRVGKLRTRDRLLNLAQTIVP